jgi:hypothetical protein
VPNSFANSALASNCFSSSVLTTTRDSPDPLSFDSCWAASWRSRSRRRMGSTSCTRGSGMSGSRRDGAVILAGACTGAGDLDRRRRKGGDDGRSSRGLGETDLTTRWALVSTNFRITSDTYTHRLRFPFAPSNLSSPSSRFTDTGEGDLDMIPSPDDVVMYLLLPSKPLVTIPSRCCFVGRHASSTRLWLSMDGRPPPRTAEPSRLVSISSRDR